MSDCRKPVKRAGPVIKYAPRLSGGCRAKNTVYAITDRRAMIIVAGKTRSVESYRAADFGNVKRVEHANGSGHLIFLTVEGRSSRGNATKREIGFMAIADVRRVEQIFNDAFKLAGGERVAARSQL